MIYLAKNLIYLRKLKELTQSEFADLIKSKKTTYSNYENEYSRPDFETLLIISKFYGLLVDQLLYVDLANLGLSNFAEPVSERLNNGKLLEEQLGEIKKEIAKLKREIDKVKKDKG